MCQHPICQSLRKSHISGSISLVFLTPGDPHLLLVKQRLGQYAGKYTVCSGKRNVEDRECWIATARRELREEIKLVLDEQQFFCLFTKLLVKGKTPVFMATLPLSPRGMHRFRDLLNRAIALDNCDSSLAEQFHEVERVDWFNAKLEPCEVLSNVVFSSYAEIMARTLRKRHPSRPQRHDNKSGKDYVTCLA